ncbi:MAG: 50S ribosomal protein L21 [Pelolinea sp.]|nr:50S ribosomal protein L21 [Pelolinea sp.]
MYSNFPADGRSVRAKCGEVKIGDDMLYAIIESGGKQYKAFEGEYIEVDLLPEDLGKKKVFEKVLLLVNGTDTQVGSPYLPEVSIDAMVSEHFKGPKIVIFNYRPKERYRVKTGHRQQFTRLLVESIQFPSKAKETKDSEIIVIPVKKVRSKPAASAKKVTEKPAKTKTASAKPSKTKAASVKPAKTKAASVKPAKKTSKKAESSKTE